MFLLLQLSIQFGEFLRLFIPRLIWGDAVILPGQVYSDLVLFAFAEPVEVAGLGQAAAVGIGEGGGLRAFEFL